MEYLIVLLIALLVLNIIIAISSDGEMEPITFIIFVLLTSIILVSALQFAASDFVANRVIKSYEKGEYKKVITINEQDTTYKYVYKCEE